MDTSTIDSFDRSVVGMRPPWECHEDTQFSCSVHDIEEMKCTSIVIAAGDTLYVPSGVVHMAQTTEHDSSLHLTIGIQPVELKESDMTPRNRSSLRAEGMPCVNSYSVLSDFGCTFVFLVFDLCSETYVVSYLDKNFVVHGMLARTRIRRECSSYAGGTSCDRECACLECLYGCDAACDTCPGTGSGSFGGTTTAATCNAAYQAACTTWTQSQSCNTADYYVQYCSRCFGMCSSDDGLSAGDTSGIVIGTFVLLGIVALVVVLVIRNQNSGANNVFRPTGVRTAQPVVAPNPLPPTRPQQPKSSETCV